MYATVVMITTVHDIMCADEFYDLPGRSYSIKQVTTAFR